MGAWMSSWGRGRWPCSIRAPDPPRLLRGNGDTLAIDATNTAALAQLGIAQSAVFSDLDQDGRPELVVASEWGALSILRNRAGRLEPWDCPRCISPVPMDGLQLIAG